MRPPPSSDITSSHIAVPLSDAPRAVDPSAAYPAPPSPALSELRVDLEIDGKFDGSLVAAARHAQTQDEVLNGLWAWSRDPRQTDGEQRA